MVANYLVTSVYTQRFYGKIYRKFAIILRRSALAVDFTSYIAKKCKAKIFLVLLSKNDLLSSAICIFKDE